MRKHLHECRQHLAYERHNFAMIIVTGGAGFIGSNLVNALNQMGEEDILIVDHLGTGEKWENLRDIKFLDFETKDNFISKAEKGLFDSQVWANFHLGMCSSTTEKKRGLFDSK